MRAFAYRFLSRARVGWSSSIAFATLGTSVTTLLLVPLLSIAYDVLMGADLSAPDPARIGYAAALVALALSIASGIVGAAATDRMLGIFLEVHVQRRFDAAYWLAIAVVPTVLSLLTGAASVAAVLTLSGNVELLWHTVALVPVTMLCGLLLGIAAAGFGLSLPDPYLGATILGAVLPVLAGVIVPIALTPTWLQTISMAVPLSGIVASLDASGSMAGLILRDLLVACLWAGAGLLFTRRAVARLRDGQRADIL